MITKELFRNLGIALACVFLTTLFLLANFLGSLIVLFCVAITLVLAIFKSEVIIVKPTLLSPPSGGSVWVHAFLGAHY